MAESAPLPETMALGEFARHIGKRASYITQLKAEGRLVLTADGRRVLVAASKQLIADSMDPAKAGVVARHAAARATTGATAQSNPADGQQGDGAAEDGVPAAAGIPADDPHARRRARALADGAEADTRKKLRDEQVELGQLLRREDVMPVVSEAVVAIRTGLENLTASLAPQLAATTDEAKCKVLMDTALEHTLTELSRRFAKIGRQG